MFTIDWTVVGTWVQVVAIIFARDLPVKTLVCTPSPQLVRVVVSYPGRRSVLRVDETCFSYQRRRLSHVYLRSGRFALGLCAAAAILGGLRAVQYPNPQAPIGNAGTAFRVTAAQGKATGPYPGTFVAKGRWGDSVVIISQQGVIAWDFYETFTITSGASKVSGNIHGGGLAGSPPAFLACPSFGPDSLQYASNYGSGTADIELIQKGNGNFSETLDAM